MRAQVNARRLRARARREGQDWRVHLQEQSRCSTGTRQGGRKQRSRQALSPQLTSSLDRQGSHQERQPSQSSQEQGTPAVSTCSMHMPLITLARHACCFDMHFLQTLFLPPIAQHARKKRSSCETHTCPPSPCGPRLHTEDKTPSLGDGHSCTASPTCLPSNSQQTHAPARVRDEQAEELPVDAHRCMHVFLCGCCDHPQRARCGNRAARLLACEHVLSGLPAPIVAANWPAPQHCRLTGMRPYQARCRSIQRPTAAAGSSHPATEGSADVSSASPPPGFGWVLVFQKKLFLR